MLQRSQGSDRLIRLTRAAEIEFARSGVASASIDSIARQARVSRQFVYTHFGGKDQLYQHVRARAQQTLFEALSNAATPNAPALTSMRAFLEAMYDAHDSTPVLGTMMADQAMHGTRIFHPNRDYEARLETIRASLDAILQRGRRDHVVRREWDSTTTYFLASALIVGAQAAGSAVGIDRAWVIAFLMRTLTTHSVPALVIDADGDRPLAPDERDAIGRILNAAEDSFATIGLEAISIRAIAQRAGVSEQLIYHYFESKPLLYQAVQTRLVERCLPYFEAIDFEGATPIEAVGRYVATYARVQANHPTSMQLDMDNRLQRRGDEVGDAAIRSRRSRLLNRIEAALRRGKDDAVIHTDIDARRIYIVAAVVFCSAGAMAGPRLRAEAGKTYVPLTLAPEHLREFIVQGAAVA